MTEFEAPVGTSQFLEERQSNPEKYGGMKIYDGVRFGFPDEGASVSIYPDNLSNRYPWGEDGKKLFLTEGVALNRLDIQGTHTSLRVSSNDLVEKEGERGARQAEGIDRGCCVALQNGTSRQIDQPEVERVLNRVFVLLRDPKPQP